MWLILLLSIAVCFLLINLKNKYYFSEIKGIVGSNKSDMPDLYKAVDEINKVIKGKFSINDYVDVKLNGNNYKLIKGYFASITFLGEYGPTGRLFGTNYLCSLNRTSLERAKGMNDLLRIVAENGNMGIFTIKSMRRLKKRIEVSP
jgi:hypothetical protein